MAEGFIQKQFGIIGKSYKGYVLYSCKFAELKINSPYKRPEKSDYKSGQCRQYKNRPPFFDCFSYHLVLLFPLYAERGLPHVLVPGGGSARSGFAAPPFQLHFVQYDYSVRAFSIAQLSTNALTTSSQEPVSAA